jgi:hypothetical protein
VAETALRAQITNPQRSFQGKRATHQFSPDGDKALVRQGALVGLDHSFEDFFFSVGRVNLAACFVFEFAYIYHDARALIKQLYKLLVNLVDAFSKFFERHKLSAKSKRLKTNFSWPEAQSFSVKTTNFTRILVLRQ